jgi:hypothetical protein
MDGAAAAGVRALPPLVRAPATSADRAPLSAARLALVVAVAITAAPLTADAQARAEAMPVPSPMVARVVAGIMSYTRWPNAAPVIRLCTIGRGPGVDALQHGADLGSPGRAVTVAPVANLVSAEQGCDAVYLGRSSGSDARQAVRLFAGRPVLMLGEGQDFCSDGGMFCVEPAADVPRFGVNLDAVARSGLRVNPQVLRIARGSEGPGS